jgi:hypothetical protein
MSCTVMLTGLDYEIGSLSTYIQANILLYNGL